MKIGNFEFIRHKKPKINVKKELSELSISVKLLHDQLDYSYKTTEGILGMKDGYSSILTSTVKDLEKAERYRKNQDIHFKKQIQEIEQQIEDTKNFKLETVMKIDKIEKSITAITKVLDALTKKK